MNYSNKQRFPFFLFTCLVICHHGLQAMVPSDNTATNNEQQKIKNKHTLVIFNGDYRPDILPILEMAKETPVLFLISKKYEDTIILGKAEWACFDVDEHFILAVPQTLLTSLSNLCEQDRDQELGLKLSTLKATRAWRKKILKTQSHQNREGDESSARISDDSDSIISSKKNKESNAVRKATDVVTQQLNKWDERYGHDNILCQHGMPQDRKQIQNLDQQYGNLGDINLAKTLATCLITNDDRNFKKQDTTPWNIVVFGHGAVVDSPDYRGQLPYIVGLNLRQFKNLLRFLDTQINTLTLTYESCFAIGPNLFYPFEKHGILQRYSYFIIAIGLSETATLFSTQNFLNLSRLVSHLQQFRKQWKKQALTFKTFSPITHAGFLQLLKDSYRYITVELPVELTWIHKPFIRLIQQTNFLPLEFITEIKSNHLHDWPSILILDSATGSILDVIFGTRFDFKLRLSNHLSLIRLAMPSFDNDNKIIGHHYLDFLKHIKLTNTNLEQVGNLFMPWCIPQIAGATTPIHINRLECEDKNLKNVTISFELNEQAARNYDLQLTEKIAACKNALQKFKTASEQHRKNHMRHSARKIANYCCTIAFKKAGPIKMIYPRFMVLKLSTKDQNKTFIFDRLQGPLINFNDGKNRITEISCLRQLKEQLESLDCKEYAVKSMNSLSSLIQKISSADLTLPIDEDLELCTFKVKTPAT